MIRCIFYISVFIFLRLTEGNQHGDFKQAYLEREVVYHLEHSESKFKRISEVGELLEIGDNTYDLNVEGNDKRYKCRELPEGEWNILNRDIANTQVHIYDPDRRNVNFDDYFIYVTREEWKCTEDYVVALSERRSERRTFTRIVQSAISIEPIKEIRYFDSTEVIRLNYLNQVAAKIVEVKYIQENHGKYQTIKYEGALGLEGQISRDIVPHLIEKLFIQFDVHEHPVFDDGLKLFIKPLKKITTLTSLSSVATCVEAQDVYPVPTYFKPDIHRVMDDGTIVKINDEQFSNYFLLFKRKIWACECDGVNYYEIENEFMSKVSVKSIHFKDVITVVYLIKYPKLGNVVRIGSMQRFKAATGEPVKRDGVRTNYQKSEKNTFSTIPAVPFGIDITYELTPKSVYRSYISSSGYDFRVGSKYDRQMGTDQDTAYCTEHASNLNTKMYTKFKIKANEDDVTYAMLSIDEGFNDNQYYKYSSTKVWACKISRRVSNPIEFFRVVNEINVLKPVREIETFDGVFLFYKDLDGQKSVDIIEIKYMTKDDLEVVMYVGQITFGNEAGIKNMNHRCAWKGIGKKLDETVPIMGSTFDKRLLRMRDFDLEDFTSTYSEIISKKNFDTSKTKSLNFTVPNIGEKVERKEILQCLQQNHEQETMTFLPPVKVVIDGSIMSIDMNDIGNFKTYFDVDAHEVWDCKFTDQETYLRVVNKLTTKHSWDRVGYNPHVDEVWLEEISGKLRYKIEDYRYYKIVEGGTKPITLNLDFILTRDVEDVDKSYSWKSGTQIFLDKNPTLVSYTFKKGIEWAKANWESNSGTSKLMSSSYTHTNLKTFKVEKGVRRLQIGSLHNVELEKEVQMTCQNVDMNDELRSYIPRVMELADDKMHYLDAEALEDSFVIAERKAWFCKHGQVRILRLFTAMCGRENIFFVTYQGGVTVKQYQALQYHGKPSGGLEITEILYIDLESSKILKFEKPNYCPTLGEPVKKTEVTANPNRPPAPAEKKGFLAKMMRVLCFGCSKTND